MAESGGASRNAVTPASTEIGWNTAFFILVALALSTMTQPVGSVLGTNPICRTYLRSSPIFCVADTVMFLVEVVVLRFSRSANWQEAVTTATKPRYEGAPEGENQQTFRMQSYMRWIAFILGGGGSILKLVAAKGVPLTQTWAFFYILSFCVFEVMISLRSANSYPAVDPVSSRCDSFIKALRETMFWLATFATTETLMATASCIQGFIAGQRAGYKAGQRASIPGLATSEDDWSIESIIMGLGNLVWVMGLFIFVLLAHPLLIRLALSRPDIGERILILDHRHAGDIRRNRFVYEDRRRRMSMLLPFLDEMEWTLYPFHMLVLQFVYGLICYKLVYDPAGTKKAPWADIFG